MHAVRAFVILAICSLSLPELAAAQFTFYFGRNKVQYEDFDWQVLRTEHFDVYYYPEMQELAEHGAHFAEEAYSELQARFEFSLTHRVPLIFYSSNLHFKQTNVTPGFIPDGVGGFFEFLKGRVVIPSNGNLHQFRRVIRHELVHVFTFTRLVRVLRDHRVPPERFLPLWFTEGLAEYWSGSRDHQHEMVMRDAVFSNYLVSLADIHRISGSFLMYKHGEALMHFIAETYGEEQILRIIEHFWMDSDFRRVLAFTLGEPFEEIDRKWVAWVRKDYLPEIERLVAPSIDAPALSADAFSAKPAFYRRRDGTRLVLYVGNRTGYTNLYAVRVDEQLRPLGEPKALIHGGRNDDFESFHVLDSRISVSREGRLAFVTKSGAHDVIHVYDLERDRHVDTFGFDELVAIYSPDWSPDGISLVFTSIRRGGFSDLFVLDTGTGDLRQLTEDVYDDRDPAWRPDGRAIVFSSDRGENGDEHTYNLFLLDLETGATDYVTSGDRRDFSPRWSPDGSHLVYTSARRDTSGRFTAQDVWTIRMQEDALISGPLAARTSEALLDLEARHEQRLTSFTTAAFDPFWTDEGHLLIGAFENQRFNVRRIMHIDSLLAVPDERQHLALAGADSIGSWTHGRLASDREVERVPYRRKYNLDVAQGAVSQNPVWGTSGGAMLAFSDMLGDDYWFVTLYNAAQGRGNFLQNLNVAVSRLELHRRTNVGYGLYRFGGLRYDITDPDAIAEFPIVWESIYGGFGSISYPLSQFRRVEFTTSLNWNEREVPVRQIRRRALLVSSSASIVHDNALYGYNGPVDGTRMNLTIGYTADALYDNVRYVSLMADVRRYFRLSPRVTFASWGLFRMNEGREARLYYLGGSWDLRGWRFFDVRARKMWFTSHELRFPILTAPFLYMPVLQPFGVTNLRGSLFLDAAHAWNDDYYQQHRQLNSGETLGAVGLGFRLNLFGGFVLRYDLGYRYRNGFQTRERFFRQFFFGYDF